MGSRRIKNWIICLIVMVGLTKPAYPYFGSSSTAAAKLYAEKALKDGQLNLFQTSDQIYNGRELLDKEDFAKYITSGKLALQYMKDNWKVGKAKVIENPEKDRLLLSLLGVSLGKKLVEKNIITSLVQLELIEYNNAVLGTLYIGYEKNKVKLFIIK